MLAGLEFLICTLLIVGFALPIVGMVIAAGWVRIFKKAPGAIALPLVVLTVALLPDIAMLVNLFTGFRMIPTIPNSNNAPLFSKWQMISGILIAFALSLSLFERTEANRIALRGSLILLLIHGAGTLLFFSDDVLAWIKNLTR